MQHSDSFPIPASLVSRAESNTPCLLVCDHASNYIPAAFNGLGLTDEQLVEHIAWDFGARELLEATAELLDCCAIQCQYSRLLIDCNRPLDEQSSIPTISEHHQIYGNQNLSPEDRQNRVNSIFQPYHCAIDSQVQRLKANHGLFPLIGIHSFTPTFHGQQRPWQFSVMWKEETVFANSVIAYFKNHSLGNLIGFNQPYSAKQMNAYTTETYADKYQLPTVVFEVRQDLLTSPRQVNYWAQLVHKAITHALFCEINT